MTDDLIALIGDADPVALIGDADPVDGAAFDRLRPSPSERELCEAIMASGRAPTRRSGSRLVLAAAAVAAVIVGTVVVWPNRTPQAGAELLAAATATDAVVSGRVELLIVDDGAAPWQYRAVAAFDDGDASSTTTFEWATASGTARIESEIRVLGDHIYQRGASPWLDDAVWYESIDRHEVEVGSGVEGTDHLLFEFGVPASVSAAGAGELVGLMTAADDFERTSALAYTASVRAGDLRGLGEVPPGLGHLLSSSTVADDELIRLTTSVTASGYLGSVATHHGTTTYRATYTDLGVDIEIGVPEAARAFVEPSLETAGPLRTIASFFNEHDDVCSDVFGRGSQYAACLRNTGYGDAADAADQVVALANSG
ncbi:MAG: hypothetical protein KDB21_06705 [Acidimicrobiales bacterium]|nr:hypothetical protein [Acidimicrobiales bacterium]